jgi:hypothetical protein
VVSRTVWTRLEDTGYSNLVGRACDELTLRDPTATQQFLEVEQPVVVVRAAEERSQR